MAIFNGTPGDDRFPEGIDNSFDDVINGLEGHDRLDGGQGNDLIHGGTGNDDISGGGGNNRLFGDDGNDGIISSTGNDLLDGGAGSDNLDGGGGNDVVNGGTGADIMHGNFGNDTYFVDNVGDFVEEYGAPDGIDTVKSSISYTLGSFVEHLTLLGSGNLSGTGNNLSNKMVGNAGANVMKGLGGNDTLLGRAGNDTLNGGTGNDHLTGGVGKDALVGGGGADTFDFNSHTETVVGANRDVVTFVRREGDKIDLSTIDANTKVAGNQGFAWGDLDAPFTGVAGQLRFAGGILSGDVNGDKKADFEIQIKGAFAAADVIL